MLGGQLANARGDLLGALGDHARRAHAAFLVAQRHGEMGRVGDHHVGLGHLGHHPAPRHLALQLTDPALDVRVALAFLVLLLDLFLGHAQLLEVVPELPGHVDRGHQQQRTGGQRAAQQHQLEQAQQRLLHRRVHQRHGVRQMAPQHPEADASDQQRLGDGLGQLDQRLRGEQPPQPLERGQPGEIGQQRLGREQPAAEHHRRQQRGDGEQQQQGQHPQQRFPHQLREAGQHAGRIVRHGGLERQRGAHHGIELAAEHPAQAPQACHAGHQHHEGAELARTHHLPLLARLFQAPG